MQLKNNRTGSTQFYYWDKKSGKELLEVIHIPAGATVEIEDKIYDKLVNTKTEVEIMEEVTLEIETGANPIEMDRKPVTIKEYYPTGKYKKVSLFEESIKSGEYIVVEKPQRSPVTDAEMAKVLNENGVSVKDMKPEQIKALYEKLA
ncbi:MAG: hypothetical protein [Caudoviricetes sp.]|nr:MAG: hypothetical protein [Caudoviricetes sp.]